MVTATPTKIKFPAGYSAELYPYFRAFLGQPRRLLDPMAGAGGVFRLHPYIPTTSIVGIELQPNFAALHPCTQVGNVLHLAYPDWFFDAVLVSPPYGNRMADHHDAKDTSRRIGYRFANGEPLHEDNSGQMQWGEKYRQFHIMAWREVYRVLEPGGRFVLNVGNHIRKGVEIDVSGWHRDMVKTLGFEHLVSVPVKTKKMKYGANHTLRVDHEWIHVFNKEKK